MLPTRLDAGGVLRRGQTGPAKDLGHGKSTMSKFKTLASNARNGFSLIEILVVLGIIAFLTAAVVVVMPRLANASKTSSTQATIKKVDELLNDRINGFDRWLQTQNTQAGNNAPSYVVAAGNGTLWSQNPQLYQFLSAKIAFRSAFPQTYAEAGSGLTPTNPSNHNQVTESAACLYYILTQKAIFDTEPPGGDLKGVEVADTDHDGLMEVVDAWGNPLRFYRWPTRLFRPAPAATMNQAQTATTNFNPFIAYPALMPSSLLVRDQPRGALPQWQGGHSYQVGTIVQPANPAQGGVFNAFMYTCTTPGTSGTMEPTWGLSANGTTSDGSVVWTASLDKLAIDSDDPNGLATPSQINETSAGNFHTWGTYHVPLIVSCGSDDNTSLGLYEPYETANFGNLAQPQYSGTPLAFQLDNLSKDISNHQK
jgi:prepilin-type N-terminal cleavage/methylation domain-containing protein